MQSINYNLFLICLSSLLSICYSNNTDCIEPDLCHHICIAESNNKFTCSCRDGYTLDNNLRDCISINEISSGSGAGIDDEPGDDDINGINEIHRIKSTAATKLTKTIPIVTLFTDILDNSINKQITSLSMSGDHITTNGNPLFGWDCLDHEDCLLKNNGGNSANSWLEGGDESPIVTAVAKLKTTIPYHGNNVIDIPDSQSTRQPMTEHSDGSGQLCDNEDNCITDDNQSSVIPTTVSIDSNAVDIDSSTAVDNESGSGSGMNTRTPCSDNVDDEDCVGSSPITNTPLAITLQGKVDPVTEPSASSTAKSSTVITRKNPRDEVTDRVPSKKHACDQVECQFDGECQLMPKGQFRCLCRLGRSGQYCERELKFVHPSFSGSSYMIFPRESSTYEKFEITIEFQASREDGLLLYSGQTLKGNKDFFAILLRNGKVEFRYDCGAGHVSISSNILITLNTWHRIHVVRFGQKGWVQVDSETPVRGSTESWYSSILTNEIYLGGIMSYNGSIGDANVTQGLTGCIRKLVVNGKYFHLHHPGNAVDGLDISDCDATLCKQTKCASKSTCMIDHGKAICLCPYGRTGQLCDEAISISIPKFNGHGFLQFDSLGLDAMNNFVIEVVFRPSTTSGLIFYNGDSGSVREDFISLSLKHGFVEFRFDCGTGPAIIRSVSPIALDVWHTVQLSRNNRKGSMKINDEKTVVGISKGAFMLLKLSSPFYVGGLKHFGDISPRASVHSHFSGCIQKLTFNKRSLDWTNPVAGTAVDRCTSHRCSKSPCQYGSCEPQGDEFVCHCHLGYYGNFCNKENPFDVPSFNGHSYLRFNRSSILKSVKGLRSSISLLFKTTSMNGLILWFGGDASKEASWSDYLAIGVSNGILSVRYDIGNGEEILNSSMRVNDNNWHEIHLSRKYRTARLSVDNNTPIVATSEGNNLSLDSRADLYIGGAFDVPGITSYRFDRGFTGCIRSLTVGSTKIHLYKHAAEGHDVKRCL